MTFSEEDMEQLFASDAFKGAIRSYLKENLTVEVSVTHGQDYYQHDDVVRVEVGLTLADDDSLSYRCKSFTTGADSVTVKPSSNDNPW